MEYRLKRNVPGFDVVDGPLAGRQYRHGVVYGEIPPAEAGKFEPVQAAPPVTKERKAEPVAPPEGEVK